MSLRLDDQLCFPLYAAARAIQQHYRPLLADLGLTYPQYLVCLVLWETDGLSVSQLGERLHLDSGTLTPLLKRMEKNGLVKRTRRSDDQRVVTVQLTPEGRALEARAEPVPHRLLECLAPPATEATLDPAALKHTLDRLLTTLTRTAS
jgi:DNA-binding MarR family transcriptional regulator